MPSIKIGRGDGGNNKTSTQITSLMMAMAATTAVEAAENGHDVELTINADNIEVYVDAVTVSE